MLAVGLIPSTVLGSCWFFPTPGNSKICFISLIIFFLISKICHIQILGLADCLSFFNHLLLIFHILVFLFFFWEIFVGFAY